MPCQFRRTVPKPYGEREEDITHKSLPVDQMYTNTITQQHNDLTIRRCKLHTSWMRVKTILGYINQRDNLWKTMVLVVVLFGHFQQWFQMTKVCLWTPRHELNRNGLFPKARCPMTWQNISVPLQSAVFDAPILIIVPVATLFLCPYFIISSRHFRTLSRTKTQSSLYIFS